MTSHAWQSGAAVWLERAHQGRTLLSRLRDQRRALVWLLVLFMLPGSGVLLAVFGFAWMHPTAMASELMRDATVVAEVPPYVGAVSNLGGMLWAGAAAVCFMASRPSPGAARRTSLQRFLLGSCVLTGALMLDDMYMVHEWVGRRLPGTVSAIPLLVFAGLAATFLAAHARTIARTDFALLLVSLGLFGGSIGLDGLSDVGIVRRIAGSLHLQYAAEDAFKFLGIAAWLGYYVRVACKETRTGGGAAVPRGAVSAAGAALADGVRQEREHQLATGALGHRLARLGGLEDAEAEAAPAPTQIVGDDFALFAGSLDGPADGRSEGASSGARVERGASKRSPGAAAG